MKLCIEIIETLNHNMIFESGVRMNAKQARNVVANLLVSDEIQCEKVLSILETLHNSLVSMNWNMKHDVCSAAVKAVKELQKLKTKVDGENIVSLLSGLKASYVVAEIANILDLSQAQVDNAVKVNDKLVNDSGIVRLVTCDGDKIIIALSTAPTLTKGDIQLITGLNDHAFNHEIGLLLDADKVKSVAYNVYKLAVSSVEFGIKDSLSNVVPPFTNEENEASGYKLEDQRFQVTGICRRTGKQATYHNVKFMWSLDGSRQIWSLSGDCLSYALKTVDKVELCQRANPIDRG